jgi:hypothetical protein
MRIQRFAKLLSTYQQMIAAAIEWCQERFNVSASASYGPKMFLSVLLLISGDDVKGW